MSTWCQLQQVQGENITGLNTWEVAESTDKFLSVSISVIDNERSTSLSVTAASEFTLTGTELSGSLDLLNIGQSTDSLKETSSGGSACDLSTLEDLGVDDERNFSDFGDLVTTGEEESWDTGGSEGRNGCESPVEN